MNWETQKKNIFTLFFRGGCCCFANTSRFLPPASLRGQNWNTTTERIITKFDDCADTVAAAAAAIVVLAMDDVDVKFQGTLKTHKVNFKLRIKLCVIVETST